MQMSFEVWKGPPGDSDSLLKWKYRVVFFFIQQITKDCNKMEKKLIIAAGVLPTLYDIAIEKLCTETDGVRNEVLS